MFTVPDLPYAYNALEPYIDEKTMQIHHDKHHATYVKNLNDVLAGHDDWLTMNVDDVVANLAKVPSDIQMKVRNNAGGHANHSLFWQVMSPNSTGAPRQARGDLGNAINTAFGSFEKFTELFGTAALNRFGSGWVWLVVDPTAASGRATLEIVNTPNQDSPITDGKTPILALDVWEHAYYLKYQNMRAAYVAAWWNVVNWTEVEKRLAAVK